MAHDVSSERKCSLEANKKICLISLMLEMPKFWLLTLNSQMGLGPVHVLREAVLPAMPFSPHISNSMWDIQIQMFSPWFRTRIWCLVPQLPGVWPDHQGIWRWGSPNISIIKYWRIFWRKDWTLCLPGKSCNHKAMKPHTSLYSSALSLYTGYIRKKLISVSCFAKHEFWLKS